MLILDGVQIVQDGFTMSADWSVPQGTFVALIGPSGAGKSTLLLAIAGFLQLAKGRVAVGNLDLGPLAPGNRPLSLLFQDQNLFPHLTIAQNLGLGLEPSLKLTSNQQGAVEHALEQVGLSGFGSRKPGSLSGGQQGRAALARALLRAKPLLLLDEPFAAFGPALKAEMLDLVTHVATLAAATVLMVTHDPADAKRVASHTILVADGVAHTPKPTAQLFADPPLALAQYLG